MPRPPGLDLLRVLDEEHQRDRGGQPNLVPCIHEELDKDLELLAAGARRLGGALFTIDTDHEWEHPPGPVVVERAGIVEGILAGLGSIDFIEDNNTVVARLAGKKTPEEPSLVLLLRAAALIASSAYDNFDLIVVAADMSSADAVRRELLWKMLTVDPVDLALRKPSTTIVPIVRARLQADLDYRRQPSPRYIVRWDRVLLRSETIRRHAIHQIVHDDRPLVLFLGAGASASSGIPLGNTYRDRALAEFLGDHRHSEHAAAFFDFIHERNRFLPGETRSREQFVRQLTLERVLRETFSELGYRPRTASPVIQELVDDCQRALQYLRPGRKAIHQLAEHMRGRLIVMTVNFDRLIEADMAAPNTVLYRPQDFTDNLETIAKYVAGHPDLPVPILKLHGSIDDPESLIATIDTTSAGLGGSVRRMLNAILDTAGHSLRWIWIGCSMRDQDVNQWLGGLALEALDDWWVDPLPGQSLDDFIATTRAPRWTPLNRTLDDRLIIDSADGFLSELAEAVALSAT
ncbi:SIR2 family protein [Mycolicibacterium fortuitum]|uniref:SIR2 family protein n=1 Tax=Mycolicibacterium fortuitum TaxID=1766 RepID=UPI000AA1B89B|nr:SIR2 family protein [Mycolicibacterium fortuitum]